MPLAVYLNTETLRFPSNPLCPHRAIFRITNNTSTPVAFKAIYSAGAGGDFVDVASTGGNIFTVSPSVGEIPHHQGCDVTVSRTPPSHAAQYSNHPAHTVIVVAAAVPLQKTPAYKPGSPFPIEHEPNAFIRILPIEGFPAINDTSTKLLQAPTTASGIKYDIAENGPAAPSATQIPATGVPREDREVTPQPGARHIIPWERAGWVENIRAKHIIPWQRASSVESLRSWMIERLKEECNVTCSPSSIALETLVGGLRMRTKTRKGDFMVMAYPGRGGGAAKIEVLARIVPRYMFKVVCVSEYKEAVLMRDHPGPFDYKVSTNEAKIITTDYVRMQMGTIGRTSELVESGLMDLRSEVLLRKLDNLEHSPMFREMASREPFKKSARWYLRTKKQIQRRVTELMGSGIPETVLGGQGCRKSEDGEHYLFHRWFEGFVGCALAAVDEWLLEDSVFLDMWSCFGDTEKMVRWRVIGKCVHWLSLLVMRLEYAQLSEVGSAEREWWVAQAGSALVKMKVRFMEMSHKRRWRRN